MFKVLADNVSVLILPLIIAGILIYALVKRVPVYEAFTEGAKDGVSVTLKIIPYLTAIIVAVSMFRASGAIDFIVSVVHGSKTFGEIFPLAIVRSLSGSAALGIFSEIAKTNPPDAYVTKLAAIMTGSSETTFYVLSVYFGAVGIKKYRYAVPAGIIADIAGIVLAIAVCKLFFG